MGALVMACWKKEALKAYFDSSIEMSRLYTGIKCSVFVMAQGFSDTKNRTNVCNL